MTDRLILADCREGLTQLDTASVDAIVCDPPYELGFMGKGWDKTGIAYNVGMWAQCLRVLKPGGHLLAFSGSRTYHRMVCAIEDAGFEIRDQIMWLYGSGFPKSLDVSKAIDKAVGATREVVGRHTGRQAAPMPDIRGGNLVGGSGKQLDLSAITAPATDDAKAWDGWGTALKPAHEPIVVARKPLIGTVVANVLQFGTGALNIDDCRVPTNGEQLVTFDRVAGDRSREDYRTGTGVNRREIGGSRWPANIIHDGSTEVLAAFPSAKGQQGVVTGKEPSTSTRNNLGLYGERAASVPRHESDVSAARFFYCAKASRADRNAGLADPGPQFEHGSTLRDAEKLDGDRRGNLHPTVKPTELMRYLVRLVMPPGGTVLDHFMGSGSTGRGAALEGFNFIGIDMTPEYVEIARARIAHARAEYEATHTRAECPQADLFGAAYGT
jgi:DNA modification methylase